MAMSVVPSWPHATTTSVPKMTEQKPSHNMPPSKVVHCRAVAEACKETDLVQAMKVFGDIKALKLMPKISQALVEFETLEAAIGCVTYSVTQPIIIHGRQMYVNYSKSNEINRKFTMSQDQAPTNILLLTVLNVIHTVNVDIIKKICRQQNVEAQRIVIFHKNGLQAFVEFKTVDDAGKILSSLNGCDVYPGCCTLKIEFSRSKPLNVRQNNDESYNIDLGEGATPILASSGARYSDWDSKPILPAPTNGYTTNPYQAPGSYMDTYTMQHYAQVPAMVTNQSSGGEGCVAMVYGINNDVMNCDRLFNLFCLYGNVMKIKILTGKQGIAMVQYAEKMSTELAIQYFNQLSLYGNQLQISFSKHPFIAEAMGTSTLLDGSPSVVSYQESRNNRFTPVPGSKNDLFSRIHPPSKVLHYFNAPPDCTETRLTELFQSFHVEVPLKHAAISKPGGKSSSGLLEFTSIGAAAEVLITINHMTLHKEEVETDKPGKPGAPFTFKLAFSQSNTINK